MHIKTQLLYHSSTKIIKIKLAIQNQIVNMSLQTSMITIKSMTSKDKMHINKTTNRTSKFKTFKIWWI